MTRLLLLAVGIAGLCAGQVLPPLIGHMRDRAGRIVPVYGVAGTFTLGQPLAERATGASFGVYGGIVRTTEGWYTFRNGTQTKLDVEPVSLLLTRQEAWIQVSAEGHCRRLSETGPGAVESCPEQVLTLEDFTTRLEFPEAVSSVEQMAAEWFVVRGERGLYAVRWAAEGEPQMWQLPEMEQGEENP